MKQIIRGWIAAAFAMVLMFMMLPVIHAAKETPELRNLAAGIGYEWSEQPYPSYNDSGNELTDGKFGSTDFFDPAWVGHLRKPARSIVFDLGEKKSISRIRAHFLQDSSVGIAYPNTVSVYASNDREEWGNLAHIPSKKTRWEAVPADTQDFVWDGENGVDQGHPNATMAYARYVKVTFTTDVFVFLDEIEIWGTDGKMNKAKQVKPDRLDYMEPGKATGGIRDLVMLQNGYAANGAGNWTKDKIMPYISYVNDQGVPQDWLFDGVLFLGQRSPDGRDFSAGTSTLSDWNWYLSKTFAAQGDLRQLNDAAAEAGTKLGDPSYKMKVVLMMPYPGDQLTDFGDVDGDGITESFNSAAIGGEAALANKQKAIRWWVERVKQEWEKAKYSNLKLSGMYWLKQGVGTTDPTEPELIQAAGELVHKNDMNFFWIADYNGNRNFDWKTLGFDAAMLQSDHYSASERDPLRMADVAGLAKQYRMGIGLRFDEQINTVTEKGQRYADDLNGGIDYGYMNNAFIAYNQGHAALLNSAVSSDPDVRQNYDWMYQFVKGTYMKPKPCSKKPEGPISPGALQYVVKCGNQITIAHKYNDRYDMWLVFDRYGANKLNGFYEWRLAANSGTDVNPDLERPSELLQGDVSDWIGPYIVKANANGNGNWASFTGGNHAYDGGNTGSPTANTDHFRVWADDVELTDGRVTPSQKVKVEVVNLIQGYNTKEQDGTGRAILQETVTYEISGGQVQVHTEIKALEDVTFETYYGLQTVNGGWNDTVRYYAGDREVGSGSAFMYSDSGTKAVNPDVDSFLLRSGDQGGYRHAMRVMLDRQYGLGVLQNLADDMPVIFTQDYGKTYFLQIKGTTPTLNNGETFSWQGSYHFYSEPQ